MKKHKSSLLKKIKNANHHKQQTVAVGFSVYQNLLFILLLNFSKYSKHVQ